MSAPAPDSGDAHQQRPSGPAPHGSTEHGHATKPTEFGRNVKEPIKGGYVIRRPCQRGGRTLMQVEFYNEDDLIQAVETRDGGKVLDRGEYDNRLGKIVVVYTSLGAVGTLADSRQRRTRRLRSATPKPPEPDCDDDYDDELSPSM